MALFGSLSLDRYPFEIDLNQCGNQKRGAFFCCLSMILTYLQHLIKYIFLLLIQIDLCNKSTIKSTKYFGIVPYLPTIGKVHCMKHSTKLLRVRDIKKNNLILD